jgi:hypothetical protein
VKRGADGVAVLWGTVAASFIVEQDGLPGLELRDGKEVWNEDVPGRRVEELRRTS